MKVLQADVCHLTNLEVYAVAKEAVKSAEKWKEDLAKDEGQQLAIDTRAIECLGAGGQNVMEYLDGCYPWLKRADEAALQRFLAGLADLPLTDSEVMQMINLAPCDAVFVHGFCRQCEARFTDEQVDRICALVLHTFHGGPAPGGVVPVQPAPIHAIADDAALAVSKAIADDAAFAASEAATSAADGGAAAGSTSPIALSSVPAATPVVDAVTVAAHATTPSVATAPAKKKRRANPKAAVGAPDTSVDEAVGAFAAAGLKVAAVADAAAAAAAGAGGADPSVAPVALNQDDLPIRKSRRGAAKKSSAVVTSDQV